jgi:hypothetical protein
MLPGGLYGGGQLNHDHSSCFGRRVAGAGRGTTALNSDWQVSRLVDSPDESSTDAPRS